MRSISKVKPLPSPHLPLLPTHTHTHTHTNTHYTPLPPQPLKAVLAAGLRSSAKPLGELGDKIFADGSAYTGPLVNGLAHGDGELKLASGAVCAGHFELDVLHGGEGKMVEPDHATSYVGQWQRGARHGQGTQGWHTGPFHNYIGEWEEGMFSGQGTLTMRTGETYSGGWAAGLRSGPGEAKVPDTGEVGAFLSFSFSIVGIVTITTTIIITTTAAAAATKVPDIGEVRAYILSLSIYIYILYFSLVLIVLIITFTKVHDTGEVGAFLSFLVLLLLVGEVGAFLSFLVLLLLVGAF
ncbi:hypothetical protein T492DRAFT_1127636, partial [Pavlovales sp. CCMP2436]